MKFPLLPVLVAAMAVLSSCGRSENTTPQASAGDSSSARVDAAVGTAEAMADKAPERVSEIDLTALTSKFKDLDMAPMRKALEGIDLSAVTQKYGELKRALANSDFVQAEFYAKKLDELLASDLVSRSIAFLKLESEKGTEQAVIAVKEYLNTPGLGENGRKMGEGVLQELQSVKREDIAGLIGLIVGLSLEQKMGHYAGPVGQMTRDLVMTCFRTYDLNTKEGRELSDAILESVGSNKAEADAAWSRVKDKIASKEGWSKLYDAARKTVADQLSGPDTPAGTTPETK